MLSVTLMNNSSPVEQIIKVLTSGPSASCALKENTSVLNPVIIIRSSDNIFSYNYMYIQEFERYYFIDDIISVNNNVWEIHAHVDVLETYANAILSNTAVIKRQANQYNLYLDDPEFKTYNTETIQTLKFKNGAGMSKNLKYILTVNGSYDAQGGE